MIWIELICPDCEHHWMMHKEDYDKQKFIFCPVCKEIDKVN